MPKKQKWTPVQRALSVLVSSSDCHRLRRKNHRDDFVPSTPTMNELKTLCQDVLTGKQFALVISKATVTRVQETRFYKRSSTEPLRVPHMSLMQDGIALMTEALDLETPDLTNRMYQHLSATRKEQSEFKKVHWNKIRKIDDRSLLIIEESLDCFLSSTIEVVRRLVIGIGKDYCDNYCLGPPEGIETSMDDIAKFWCDHYEYFPESILLSPQPELGATT